MFTKQVRKVLARYIEDPDQGSSYNSLTKSWMQYEKDKNKDLSSGKKHPLSDGIKKDFDSENIPGDPGSGEQVAKGVSYNPYDYKDPSTKPKDLNDSGTYIKEYPPATGLFYFSRPSLFKEDGPLYEWAKSRREDWTADPSQQSPAMSLDRRFASNQIGKVVSLYLLNDIPIQKSVQVKTAASLLQIDSMFRGGDPKMYSRTVDKSSQVSDITWINKSNRDQITRGLYQFTVPSSSGEGSYNVYLQFLRTKDKKETPRGYLDFDVELSCSCDSFLFFGAQYYAVQGKYMYMPGFRPALLPPHPRTQTVSITRSTKEQLTGEEPGKGRDNKGKGLNFRMCKHLMKVLDFVRDNLRVDEVAAKKNYPLVGRPSYIVNKDKWEEVFKFPFTLEEIKKNLTSGLNKVPNFYRTVYTREKKHYDQVDSWVREVFNALPSSQRIAYLRFLVEHPEEIFYILWRHAVDIYPDRIDPILVSTGFRLMDKTIKSESDQKPEGVLKDTEGKNVYNGPNMTGVVQPTEMTKPGEGSKDKKEENKYKIGDPKNTESKKYQPLKGKRIPSAIKENLKNQKADRGLRKTDIKNDI